MPYIIKNGKTYTGNSVSLTQAQYNALSDAEKNNGITYYIYDSDAVLDASDVGLGTGSVETLAGSVAVIETSPATASHAVGSYIVWNGQLYEVTASIAVGETLTVGTNITAKTVGGELTTLKNGLSTVTNRVNSRARALRFGGSSVTSFKIECINAYQIILVVANSGQRLFMITPNNGSPVITMFAGSGITVSGLTSLSFSLNNCPTYTQFMAISYDDFSISNN